MSDDKVLQLLENQQVAMQQQAQLLQQMAQLLQAQGVQASSANSEFNKSRFDGIIGTFNDGFHLRT